MGGTRGAGLSSGPSPKCLRPWLQHVSCSLGCRSDGTSWVGTRRKPEGQKRLWRQRRVREDSWEGGRPCPPRMRGQPRCAVRHRLRLSHRHLISTRWASREGLGPCRGHIPCPARPPQGPQRQPGLRIRVRDTVTGPRGDWDDNSHSLGHSPTKQACPSQPPPATHKTLSVALAQPAPGQDQRRVCPVIKQPAPGVS